MDEKWKEIPNTDGWYDISNHGRIRSWKNNRWGRRKNPKILKPTKTSRGYLHVGLYTDNGIKDGCIHRLVANAFVDNPENKPQVNHIDANKQNNRSDNLEWVTNKENINHARDMGLTPCGESSSMSKLSKNDVIEIREKYEYGIGKILANKYGVTSSQITNIARRESWIHVD